MIKHKNNTPSASCVLTNLVTYGVLHFLVDATCAGLILSVLSEKIIDPTSFFGLVIVYNILAFGSQVFIGLISDYIKSPRLITLSGCLLVGIAALLYFNFPITAIVLSGIGNALFHVGGGSVSLNLTPKQATAPGIYVAPGTLGLFLGAILAKAGQFVAWPFIALLFVFSILIFYIEKPEIDYNIKPRKSSRSQYLKLALILVLLSIAVRSLIGSILIFPWKNDLVLLTILTLAIVLGKSLGGVLADRFSWMRIAVGALTLSIPLLTFGANIPLLAITGMLLFNMTMPVTLVLVSNILQGRPGFAFGLTCLAILLGATLSFSSLRTIISVQYIIIVIILISSLSLYYGIRQYNKHFA